MLIFFRNMVMWHIELKGMMRRKGFKQNVYPRVKLSSLWWGQKVKYYFISSKALGFAMVRHRPCILVSF